MQRFLLLLKRMKQTDKTSVDETQDFLRFHGPSERAYPRVVVPGILVDQSMEQEFTVIVFLSTTISL